MDSSLFYYAREGSTDGILNQFRNRLHEFQDVDSVRDEENNTLLHVDVSCSNSKTVSLLLERRADVFAVNKHYDTPLSLAKDAYKKAVCTPEESEVFRIIKHSVDQRGNSAKENIQRQWSEAIDFPCDDGKRRRHSMSNCPGREHRVTEEKYESKEGNTREAEERNNSKCQEKPSQTINKVEDAQTCWDAGDYEVLLTLLKNDCHFPVDFSPKNIDEGKRGAEELKKFVKQRNDLHGDIELGNLGKVKEATKFSKSFLYLNMQNKSALYCAAKNRKLGIFAYFKFINLRYRDSDEKDCEKKFSENESEAINRLMDDYTEERGNFHILKLVTSTRVLGKFTEEQEKITEDLYKYLEKSDFVNLLMKVLKYENIQATFDFERENTERLYQGSSQGTRGISETIKRKMFIGAKGCAPQAEGGSFENVAGTVAHEVCHLALEVLYENDAKPYKRDETDKMREFDAIAIEIKEALSSHEVHDVIARVFKYHKRHWHAELIVRVPHILALIGESRGKDMLEIPVLRKLYDYYEKNIVPHCKTYSEGKNFKHHLIRMKDVKDFGAFAKEMESAKYMNKVPFDQIETKFISYKNLSIVVTSSVHLSSSVIYHHLKSIYYFHFDKRCLFIKLNAFINDFSIILNAYKFSACEYLVLSANDASVDFRDISVYFNQISFRDEKKKVILVVRSDCKDLKPEWRNKIQYHHWKDLADSSRENILYKKVTFQGTEMKLEDLVAKLFETKNSKLTVQDEDLVASIIQAEELSYLIDEENISIGNADHQKFPENSNEFYMKRNFTRQSLMSMIYIVVKGKSILPMDKAMEEINETVKEIEEIIEEMDIPISSMVRLVIDDCMLMGGKFTLLKLRHGNANLVFEKIPRYKNDTACIFCYNFEYGKYYTSMSEENARKMVDFCKSDNISEGELITFSDNVQDRVVIISDEPGAGKSTVVAEIIRKLKEKAQGFWVERIDLNDFADGEKNPVGLKHLESMQKSEEVTDFFMKMVGLRNCLERTFFKLFLDRPSKMKVFFDGFDEISPSYKDCVMKILRVLIDKTKVQIWITTRKHEQKYLESSINTFSYNLEELFIEDQSILVGKIWKHKIKCGDGKQIPENEESEDTAVFFRIENNIRGIVEQLENNLQNDIPKGSDIQKENDLQKKKDSQDAKLKLMDELQNLISFVEKNRGVKSFNRVVKNLKKKVDEVDLASYAVIMLRNMPDNSIVDENNFFTGVPLQLYLVAVLVYDKNFEFNAYSDMYTLYTDVMKGKMEIYLGEKGKSVQKTQSNLTKEEAMERKIYEMHETLACKVIKDENWDDDWITEMDKQLLLEFGVVVQHRNKLSFMHRMFTEFFYCKWMLKQFETGERILKDLEKYNTDSSSKDEESSGIPKNLVEEKESFVSFLNSIRSSVVMSVHILSVLSRSLSDDLFIALFIVDDLLFDSIVENVNKCSVEAIDLFLHLLKKTICLKVYKRSGEHALGTSTDEEVDNKFEEIKIPYGICETISLLERTDRNGHTLLIKASTNEYTVFSKVLKFFKEILGKDVLAMHLAVRNCDGQTLLHRCSFFGSRSGECDGTLNMLVKMKHFFKEDDYTALVKERDILGCNFLHYLGKQGKTVVMKEALSHLDRWSRDVLLGLVLAKDYNGLNVLHSASKNVNIGVLKEIVLWAKRVMSDDQFLVFVKSRDYLGNTIFHTRAETNFYFAYVCELQFLKDFLEHRSLLELMTGVNAEKETFLHVSADRQHSMEIIYATEVLDPQSLEEFLSKVNSNGDTFLHQMAKKEYRLIWNVLSILKEKLLEPSLKRLLEIRSGGRNVLDTVAMQDSRTWKEIMDMVFPPKAVSVKD